MLGIAIATTVDHTEYMTPVKRQGCGDCWAFAATSALEGTIAKTLGEAPKRLSEQQAVDCTNRTSKNRDRFGKDYAKMKGCDGGRMKGLWKFYMKYGAMLDEDYPYKGEEQDCRHRDSKTIGKTLNYDKKAG